MPNFEPDEFGRETIAKLHEYCDQYERDPSEIGIEVTVNVLGKSRDQWLEDAELWRELGATHLSANTMREVWSEDLMMWSKDNANPLTEVEQHVDVLADYRERLAPILQRG